MSEVPDLSLERFFKELDPVERAILASLVSVPEKPGPRICQPWYPVRANGDCNFEASCEWFAARSSVDEAAFPPITMTSTSRHCDPLQLWAVNGRAFVYGGWDAQMERYFLRGPVFLGHRFKLHSFSKVVGPGCISDDVSVGSYVSLTRCVVRRGTTFDDRVHFEDALIGAGVTVGLGAQAYARKFPKRGIPQLFSVVLGDGVIVEPWAKFRPGTFVEPGVTVYEGMTVGPGLVTQAWLERRREAQDEPDW